MLSQRVFPKTHGLHLYQGYYSGILSSPSLTVFFHVQMLKHFLKNNMGCGMKQDFCHDRIIGHRVTRPEDLRSHEVLKSFVYQWHGNRHGKARGTVAFKVKCMDSSFNTLLCPGKKLIASSVDITCSNCCNCDGFPGQKNFSRKKVFDRKIVFDYIK